MIFHVQPVSHRIGQLLLRIVGLLVRTRSWRVHFVDFSEFLLISEGSSAFDRGVEICKAAMVIGIRRRRD